ncbi:ABC transporter ATP-binding protein [Methylocapsa sp. S129]|uniref:ABC transporter ATP-binding protein n=1 Tax=Methylocapsa sp. S129 TaxID=1641869 RepID=UPI00131A96ED|nr:ABC transporter ATP-binding protein [Methylocapsa sp. S129]
MSLLEVANVDTAYGAVAVNRDVSLSVAEGEIATILGPNGAGKSTLMRAICGLLKPKRGRIMLDGHDVTGLPPDRLAKLGVVMVPEGRRIFADLTVRENLRLGAYSREDQGEVEADIGRMESYFSILADKRSAKGGELSGGQQQMLAIARGLMARPRLLLLDEPSLGLSPLMVREVQSVIIDVRKNFGAAVLLVEQNAGLALSVAARGYLMQSGKIVLASAIADLRDSTLMRELYLGGGKRPPIKSRDVETL